jgi:ketosteroid isomerase-like protein
VRAWNSHNLAAIMHHYAEDVVLISPAAARILGDPSGTVRGANALRAYFMRGLETYSDLAFDLIDVTWGVSSVVLFYVNQKGTKAGEFMELNANHEATRVVAHYDGWR